MDGQAKDRERELIDPTEAAAILKCSPTYARMLCSTGAIPAVKIGKRWRINHKKLLEYAGLA